MPTIGASQPSACCCPASDTSAPLGGCRHRRALRRLRRRFSAACRSWASVSGCSGCSQARPKRRRPAASALSKAAASASKPSSRCRMWAGTASAAHGASSRLLDGVARRGLRLLHPLLSRAGGATAWWPPPPTARTSRRLSSATTSSACSSIPKSPATPAADSQELLRGALMLTKRIIACLDVTAGRVVKGVQFLDLRRRRRSGGAGASPRRKRRR